MQQVRAINNRLKGLGPGSEGRHFSQNKCVGGKKPQQLLNGFLWQYARFMLKVVGKVGGRRAGSVFKERNREKDVITPAPESETESDGYSILFFSEEKHLQILNVRQC